MEVCFVRAVLLLTLPWLALFQQPPFRPSDGALVSEPTNGTDGNAVNIGDSFLLRSLRQGDANARSQFNQLRHSVTSPLQALFNLRGPSQASDIFDLWHTLAIARGLLPNTVAFAPRASTGSQSRPWSTRTNVPLSAIRATTTTPALPAFPRFRVRGNSNNQRLRVQSDRDQINNRHIRVENDTSQIDREQVLVQNNRIHVNNRRVPIQNTRGNINNRLVNVVRNTLFPEDSNRLLRSGMGQRLNTIRSNINLRRNQDSLHGQINNGRLSSMLRGMIQPRESISGETQRSPVSSSVNRSTSSLLIESDSSGTPGRIVNTASGSSGTPDAETAVRLATAGSRDILMNHVLRQIDSVPLSVTEASKIITSVNLGNLVPVNVENQSQSGGRGSRNGNMPKDTTPRSDHSTEPFNSFDGKSSGSQTPLNVLSNISQIVANNGHMDNKTTVGHMETKPEFIIKDLRIGNDTAFSSQTTNNVTRSANATGIHIVDMHVADDGINIPIYDFVLQNVGDIVTEHGLVRSEYNEQLVGDTALYLGIRQLPMLPIVTDRFHPKAEIVQAQSREEKVGDGKGVVVKYVGDVTMQGGDDVVFQYIGDIVTSDGITNILVPVNVSRNATEMTNETNSTASTFTTVTLKQDTQHVLTNNANISEVNLTVPQPEERASGIPALVGPRLTLDSFDRKPFEMGVFLGVTRNGNLSILRDISKFLGFRGVNINALDLTAKQVEFPVVLMHLFNNQGSHNNNNNNKNKNVNSVSDQTNTEQIPLQDSSSKSSSPDRLIEPNRPNESETRSGQSVLSTADQINMWLGLDPVIHLRPGARNQTESDRSVRNNTERRDRNGNVRQRVQVLHASFG